MQQPQQGVGGTADELRSDAQQLKSTTANRLHSEVDARKGDAANQVKSVSSAIQTAADGLDEGAPQWLRSAFQQGADQIQRFAESLEQKDSRQIFDEVQSFARQRPGVFLGACAAAGFAASRIFKAGGEPQTNPSVGQSDFRQSGFVDSEFGQSGLGQSSMSDDAFGQNELSDDTMGQGDRSSAIGGSTDQPWGNGQQGSDGSSQGSGDRMSDDPMLRGQSGNPSRGEFV